jgi:hypothetical protein
MVNGNNIRREHCHVLSNVCAVRFNEVVVDVSEQLPTRNVTVVSLSACIVERKE